MIHTINNGSKTRLMILCWVFFLFFSPQSCLSLYKTILVLERSILLLPIVCCAFILLKRSVFSMTTSIGSQHRCGLQVVMGMHHTLSHTYMNSDTHEMPMYFLMSYSSAAVAVVEYARLSEDNGNGRDRPDLGYAREAVSEKLLEKSEIEVSRERERSFREREREVVSREREREVVSRERGRFERERERESLLKREMPFQIELYERLDEWMSSISPL